jgi:glycogen(starch) synthase
VGGAAVLHVVAASYPRVDGYTTRLASTLQAQRRAGMCVEVVTAPFYPDRVPRDERVVLQGVTHHQCPVSRMSRKWRGGQYAAASGGVCASMLGAARTLVSERVMMGALRRRIIEAATGMQAQVIHAHTPYRCGMPALSAGRQLGLPVVYEVRGLWEDSAVTDGLLRFGGLRYRYMKWRETRVMKAADGVIVISDGLRKDVESRGVESDKIFVSPNGCDSERLGRPARGAKDAAAKARMGLPPGVVIGYCGSLRPLEGVDKLIKVVARLRGQQVQCVGMIVGAGPSLPALQQEASRLGVSDAILFAGEVPPSDVGAYYDMIDVFLCSRSSSRVTDLVTPIKPLEAMGRGKSVVMPRLPALIELGAEAGAAVLYQTEDMQDLVTVVGRLVRDKALRAQLGERARDWVLSSRSWDSSILGTLDAYALVGADVN